MEYEIIQGNVSELNRDSFSQTSGSIKNRKGKIKTELKTIYTFKLENMNKVFRYEGNELIENGDKIAFITSTNPTKGYFKIRSIKNLTRAWFNRNKFGLSWVALLILWFICAFPISAIFSGYIPFIVWFIFFSVIFGVITYISYKAESDKNDLVKRLKAIT